MKLFRIARPGIVLFKDRFWIGALWLFILIFPKGGFKVGLIPITWGYLILGFLGITFLVSNPIIINRKRATTLLSLLPFQIISLLCFALTGIENMSLTISFVISFFFIPWIFLTLLSQKIEYLKISQLKLLIKKGIFYIAAYGIFLFLYKQYTGKFLEIPFLTVNFSDFGNIEGKNIERGIAFKLISTYNNGNIYGPCVLMLLPLYCYIEKSPLRKLIVKTSLILTLSRTVWIGLLFNELCNFIFFRKNSSMSFIKPIGAILFSLIGLYSIVLYYGIPIEFVFDLHLGGREAQFENFQINLLSKVPFVGIIEIVYLSILSSFGLIGLISFLVAMISPIALNYSNKPEIKKTILFGLINYLIVCCSDGAMLYIPTMAIYWFLVSLLCRKNHAEI